MPEYLYVINGGFLDRGVQVVGHTDNLEATMKTYVPYYGKEFNYHFVESKDVQNDMVQLKKSLSSKLTHKYENIYYGKFTEVKHLLRTITKNVVRKCMPNP